MTLLELTELERLAAESPQWIFDQDDVLTVRNALPQLLKSLRSLMAENEALKKERDELAGRAQRSFDNLMKERDTLLAEVAVARERLGPAGYKIIQEVAALQAQLKGAQEALRGAIGALEFYAEKDAWAEFISNGNIFGECDGDLMYAFDKGEDSPWSTAREALAKLKERK